MTSQRLLVDLSVGNLASLRARPRRAADARHARETTHSGGSTRPVRGWCVCKTTQLYWSVHCLRGERPSPPTASSWLRSIGHGPSHHSQSYPALLVIGEVVAVPRHRARVVLLSGVRARPLPPARSRVLRREQPTVAAPLPPRPARRAVRRHVVAVRRLFRELHQLLVAREGGPANCQTTGKQNLTYTLNLHLKSLQKRSFKKVKNK